jgi:type VI secretion system secreted protein Hcp
MKSLTDIYSALTPNPNQKFPLPDSSLVEGTDMIHLSIIGRSGEIQGSCTAEGREGTIVVENISHDLISPRDAASGLPTGKRQHKPVTITKRLDKATPLLYSAIVNNETLSVTLRFYRTGPDKIVRNYYTIDLQNANVADIHTGPRDTEVVSFTYQKITWTWTDGGITAQDDWEAPVV